MGRMVENKGTVPGSDVERVNTRRQDGREDRRDEEEGEVVVRVRPSAERRDQLPDPGGVRGDAGLSRRSGCWPVVDDLFAGAPEMADRLDDYRADRGLDNGCSRTPETRRPQHPTRGQSTPEASQTQAPVTPATEPERRTGTSLTTPSRRKGYGDRGNIRPLIDMRLMGRGSPLSRA